ncbi:MAG: DUF1858 domain-containing protein [Candidatus Micrarchaeota archaeon]|nr:DUF1858 domain-containing protein [Candidatus Micrarchaeota archaeon]
MPLKINRDIMIGELILNYPAAVEVLFQYGFHCIGCGLSSYETLGQGCLAHGFDEATLDKVIEDIKKAVAAGEEREKARMAKKK